MQENKNILYIYWGRIKRSESYISFSSLHYVEVRFFGKTLHKHYIRFKKAVLSYTKLQYLQKRMPLDVKLPHLASPSERERSKTRILLGIHLWELEIKTGTLLSLPEDSTYLLTNLELGFKNNSDYLPLNVCFVSILGAI